MSTQRYSVTPHPIETVLTWIKSGVGDCDPGKMAANLVANCVQVTMLGGEIKEFGKFLAERRRLMALKIKTWFEVL